MPSLIKFLFLYKYKILDVFKKKNCPKALIGKILWINRFACKKGFGFLEDIFLKEFSKEFFLEFVLYFSHQFYKHFTVSEPKESN